MADAPEPHDVPPPRRAGDTGIGWKQVLAGFGIAAAVVWGLRVPLFLVGMWISDAWHLGYDGILVLLAAWALPILLLVVPILWASRRGRKGWAVGMSIYAALGVLFIGACYGALSFG